MSGLLRKLWRRLRGKPAEKDLPPEQPLRIPEQFRNIGRQPPDQTPAAGRDSEIDFVYLRQQMLNSLSVPQLTAIAAGLGLDFDSFPGGKGRKTQAFLGACQRQALLPQLLEACREEAPELAWQPED